MGGTPPFDEGVLPPSLSITEAAPPPSVPDGVIDFTDLNIWFRTFGDASASGTTGEDATHDGVVDFTDLSIWSRQFGGGATSASTATTPEDDGGLSKLNETADRMDARSSTTDDPGGSRDDMPPLMAPNPTDFSALYQLLETVAAQRQPATGAVAVRLSILPGSSGPGGMPAPPIGSAIVQGLVQIDGIKLSLGSTPRLSFLVTSEHPIEVQVPTSDRLIIDSGEARGLAGGFVSRFEAGARVSISGPTTLDLAIVPVHDPSPADWADQPFTPFGGEGSIRPLQPDDMAARFFRPAPEVDADPGWIPPLPPPGVPTPSAPDDPSPGWIPPLEPGPAVTSPSADQDPNFPEGGVFDPAHPLILVQAPPGSNVPPGMDRGYVSAPPPAVHVSSSPDDPDPGWIPSLEIPDAPTTAGDVAAGSSATPSTPADTTVVARDTTILPPVEAQSIPTDPTTQHPSWVAGVPDTQSTRIYKRTSPPPAVAPPLAHDAIPGDLPPLPFNRGDIDPDFIDERVAIELQPPLDGATLLGKPVARDVTDGPTEPTQTPVQDVWQEFRSYLMTSFGGGWTAAQLDDP
ncbi:MAG TPA: hypothetical protein VF484_03910, partial [Candidatus Limnocylindrales bacterium]